MNSTYLSILVLLVSVVSATADGCPVCGFGQDGTQFAFILTTGLLTALPLIMIATIVYVLWRRANRVQDQ